MGENIDFSRDLFEKITLPPEFIYESSLSLKENENIHFIQVNEWIRINIKEECDIYRIHMKILDLSDKSQWLQLLKRNVPIDESFAILILRYYSEYYDVPIYEV